MPKNILKDKIKKLPVDPGVYLFLNASKEIIYVGKAISLRKRVSSYFVKENLGPKTDRLVSQIAYVKFIKVFSEFEALLLEAELIKSHKPFFNVQAKDDKSPLYIKITNDDIPLVTVTRREKRERGVYLKGPFPSAKTTRDVLKIIRKIFPYCRHKNPKKPCLYVHLGLCPYPYGSQDKKEKYLQTAEKIKKLLSGKNKALIRDIAKQMQSASKNLRYEEASELKLKIQKLQYILTTFHAPREFLERPTLVDDLNMTKLKDLKEKLEIHKIPKRIECYDISNIGGKLATGSMVVFKNGRAGKGEYRRFRIKFKKTADDYDMLREILARRFKHEWPHPDLIIIDGGRGQLNAALSIMSKYKLSIPVVSLAKKLETIFVPGKVLPISLEKDSPARQLAQAIRDEAHRVAIRYHRLLRSKDFLRKNQ
ncbi:MAG: hypothetical protein COU81_01160 [Candidatus Portnoybacteria bacterium CG10_big_fil_rev_8_21_14_0_10_36_7]|uniref:Excinuclease ABC subunit C n=1 Tax=Candidatus Portnoybacteria bacterium CG10_big_fil_rev_8_21_14_0_10_36_7 TaxID=1974812 RepID=A0A2M8KEM9_9BACT|nr:MAG: hypothetical protein COU81_01160 [Candidatus Portnoybacteria bacterium CG10_big_fil_rev_8_21_14_0_10_36_7]